MKSFVTDATLPDPNTSVPVGGNVALNVHITCLSACGINLPRHLLFCDLVLSHLPIQHQASSAHLLSDPST